MNQPVRDCIVSSKEVDARQIVINSWLINNERDARPDLRVRVDSTNYIISNEKPRQLLPVAMDVFIQLTKVSPYWLWVCVCARVSVFVIIRTSITTAHNYDIQSTESSDHKLHSKMRFEFDVITYFK